MLRATSATAQTSKGGCSVQPEVEVWRSGDKALPGICAENSGVSVVIRRHVLALYMCVAHSCARGGAAGEREALRFLPSLHTCNSRICPCPRLTRNQKQPLWLAIAACTHARFSRRPLLPSSGGELMLRQNKRSVLNVTSRFLQSAFCGQAFH